MKLVVRMHGHALYGRRGQLPSDSHARLARSILRRPSPVNGGEAGPDGDVGGQSSGRDLPCEFTGWRRAVLLVVAWKMPACQLAAV